MGKRKKEETNFYDLSSSSSPACMQELPRMTRQKSRELQNMGIQLPPCFLDTAPCQEKSKRRNNDKNPITKQNQKLDSNVFERYLENLWKNFSGEKRTSFAYLDCLWFSLYRKRATKAKVLMWIKSKDIFSSKYVFVPIICWNHWSLLILCHMGESLKSKSIKPCMLLLDSLEMANPKRIEPDIRKFVFDIYKAEGRLEDKKSIESIPLMVPKVPQQKNSDDCGIFVLYFINLFLENIPENFNISEGYPHFINENWFSSESLECFCKKVRTFCRQDCLIWSGCRKNPMQWMFSATVLKFRSAIVDWFSTKKRRG